MIEVLLQGCLTDTPQSHPTDDVLECRPTKKISKKKEERKRRAERNQN